MTRRARAGRIAGGVALIVLLAAGALAWSRFQRTEATRDLPVATARKGETARPRMRVPGRLSCTAVQNEMLAPA